MTKKDGENTCSIKIKLYLYTQNLIITQIY